MAKKKTELLSEKQEKQLQDMVNNMLDIAADVVEDYKDVDLSELQALSGSITQIHEDSPFLKEKDERLISFDGKKMSIKSDSK